MTIDHDVTLLDELLPQYDVSSRHSISIRATPERIYAILQHGIPSGMITRLLMAIRGLPARLRRKTETTLNENAFYRLKHLQNQEIVIGIIGQFWKPVAIPLPIHSLEEFLEFQRPNFCKAALNLRIVPQGPSRCLLTTETRVLAFGPAKGRFKEYWRLIGPFSGVIRREVLRKIKHHAEKKG